VSSSSKDKYGTIICATTTSLIRGISQERKVIIMSTVRSTQDLMAYDLKHTLGFVGNPRRFNGMHLLLLHFMFD
jgi:hypothetical protein